MNYRPSTVLYCIFHTMAIIISLSAADFFALEEEKDIRIKIKK